jgi:two-component system response regulator HydG
VLIDWFLERASASRGEAQKRLSPGAQDAMVNYSWPGNVRELENALERAVILTSDDVIELAALPERVTAPEPVKLVDERPVRNPTLETIERAYIMWVLQSEAGNKTRAAETLGIDPSTLHRKLSRFGAEA